MLVNAYKYKQICRNIQEYIGIYRNNIGIYRNIQEYIGIYRNMRKTFGFKRLFLAQNEGCQLCWQPSLYSALNIHNSLNSCTSVGASWGRHLSAAYTEARSCRYVRAHETMCACTAIARWLELTLHSRPRLDCSGKRSRHNRASVPIGSPAHYQRLPELPQQ